MKESTPPAFIRGMLPTVSRTREQLLATAEREGPDAQNNLGIIFIASENHADSETHAAGCFLAAARQGYSPAQYNLALLYERGRGVAQNREEARVWFLRAAEQGHSASQFHLGLQSHRKSLDPANADAAESKVEALKWLLLAAEQAHHNAETLCGSLILDMSYDQVRESNRRALMLKSFFS